MYPEAEVSPYSSPPKSAARGYVKDWEEVEVEVKASPPAPGSIPRRESKVLMEYDDTKDNKRLSLVSGVRVMRKTGPYIYNMGLVNFFEYLVINLMLTLHVWRK